MFGCPICTSLAQALFHLSRSKERQCYCFDAICINQHNTFEKAVQVANIIRIFAKADDIVTRLIIAEPYMLAQLADCRMLVDNQDIVISINSNDKHAYAEYRS
jgi:hypothetical protein